MRLDADAPPHPSRHVGPPAEGPITTTPSYGWQLTLIWIEEPAAADDDAGHARIAREATTPIQLGENWWGRAHLLAATPTAHWLEYTDWASPILQEHLRVEAGQVIASSTPEAGLS